eukprot:434114-Rhodomonas_salina.1
MEAVVNWRVWIMRECGLGCGDFFQGGGGERVDSAGDEGMEGEGVEGAGEHADGVGDEGMEGVGGVEGVGDEREENSSLVAGKEYESILCFSAIENV